MITMCSTQNSSIQSKIILQTWTWPVHSRLAVKTKPQGKRWWNMGYEKIYIDAINTITDILNCMTIQELQQAVKYKDNFIQQLKEHNRGGWSQSRNELPQEVRLYWTLRDHMAVTGGIVLRNKWIVITRELQKQGTGSTTQYSYWSWKS